MKNYKGTFQIESGTYSYVINTYWYWTARLKFKFDNTAKLIELKIVN